MKTNFLSCYISTYKYPWFCFLTHKACSIYYPDLSRKCLPTSGLKNFLTTIEETEAWSQKVTCGRSVWPLVFVQPVSLLCPEFFPSEGSVVIHPGGKTMGSFNCIVNWRVINSLKRAWSPLVYEPVPSRFRKIICWSHLFTKYRHWDSLQMRLQTEIPRWSKSQLSSYNLKLMFLCQTTLPMMIHEVIF